jgi:phosphoglycolate phosphatase
MSASPRPIAILFDLDGTLVDSVADLTVSANATLEHYGLPALGESEVASYIGDGARRLLERCLGAADAEVDLSDALRRFRSHYLEQCTELTRPYPGVAAGLARLSPMSMAIVTNKPEPMAERIADSLDLRRYLGAVIGARPKIPVKPDPALLSIAMGDLGVNGSDALSPERTWMVGDSPNDIRAGRALGLSTIAVSWGFTPREKLEGLDADHLVDSFDEITEILAND